MLNIKPKAKAKEFEMTETNWDNPGWPNWGDACRPVEVEIDGKIHKGYLDVDGVFDGEDEIPIFSVVGENDQTIHFDFDGKWRFTDGGE